MSEWQRREKVWLDVFKILRLSSAITVSVIILISGLGMFSVLAIIVMEKTREIAILRSMGYQRGDISKSFSARFCYNLVRYLLVGSLAF